MNLKPVNTPSKRNPFVDPHREQLLWTRLGEDQRNRSIPNGYRLRPEENGYDEYESVELLPNGRRSSKQKMRAVLPESIWLPRLVLWIQALEAMTYLNLPNM